MNKAYEHYRSDLFPRNISHEPSGGNLPDTNHQRQSIGRRAATTNDTNAILLAIVFLFFCCHSLRLVTFFYNDRITEFADECITFYNDVTTLCEQNSGLNFNLLDVPVAKYPPWLWHVNTVSSFLLCLNSSLNFFLYVLSGKRFRKTFCKKMAGLLSHCGLCSNVSSDESMSVQPGMTQTPGIFFPVQ